METRNTIVTHQNIYNQDFHFFGNNCVNVNCRIYQIALSLANTSTAKKRCVCRKAIGKLLRFYVLRFSKMGFGTLADNFTALRIMTIKKSRFLLSLGADYLMGDLLFCLTGCNTIEGCL